MRNPIETDKMTNVRKGEFLSLFKSKDKNVCIFFMRLESINDKEFRNRF